MAVEKWLVFFFVLIGVTCDVLAYPNSGKFQACKLSSNTISGCKQSLALYEGGMVFLEVKFGTLPKGLQNVIFTYDVRRGRCAMKGSTATEECSVTVNVPHENQKPNMTLVLTGSVLKKVTKEVVPETDVCPFSVEGKIAGGTTPAPEDTNKGNNDQPKAKVSNDQPKAGGTTPAPEDTTEGTTPAPGDTTTKGNNNPPGDNNPGQSRKRRDEGSANSLKKETKAPDHYAVRALSDKDLRNREMAVIEVGESDIYTVFVKMSTGGKVNLTVDVFITMFNQHGYLDAADFPSMVFYALMFVVYIVLGLIWSVCMCCSCKDLIRLQLFIGVAIVMGFVEKLFFVIEYGSVNTTGGPYGDLRAPLLLVAEGISAGKKMFARVLLVIISSGFGTVKPRLGGLLWKVVVFGAIFFAVTFADGLARSWNYVTIQGFEQWMTVTMIAQVVLDTFCLYWILSNLIDTRRTLKLRRNFKKLTFYNHLLVTFLFVAVGVLAFLLWILVTGIMDKCDEDWTAMWLKECFWPLLFTILLVVVMVLWRPSSNAVRFAYSAVSNDDDEEIQQKANENFETMKMRHGSKSEVLPPKPSAETEEDLKWVEENLPASTIDQVLQPLMDSDEELMTTRFERSKMD